jgi:hypothetical protein
MPLTFHVLNVGQGDCTIIKFPSGRVAMVDIDNLRVLDKDTAAELVEEYRGTSDYTSAPASSARKGGRLGLDSGNRTIERTRE